MTPLEPFFEDNARREGIPTPFPTAGMECLERITRVCNGSRCVQSFDPIPDIRSVFWRPRHYQLLEAALAKKPSSPMSLTRQTGSHTDGFTG